MFVDVKLSKFIIHWNFDEAIHLFIEYGEPPFNEQYVTIIFYWLNGIWCMTKKEDLYLLFPLLGINARLMPRGFSIRLLCQHWTCNITISVGLTKGLFFHWQLSRWLSFWFWKTTHHKECQIFVRNIKHFFVPFIFQAIAFHCWIVEAFYCIFCNQKTISFQLSTLWLKDSIR